MATPTIYLNLEDDVSKIIERVKRVKSDAVILVCPKRCFLFNDSINLRLLKKQTDMLGKRVAILTMDERGQNYAKEAGFELKFLPKSNRGHSFSDIRPRAKPQTPSPAAQGGILSEAVSEIKNISKKFLGHPTGSAPQRRPQRIKPPVILADSTAAEPIVEPVTEVRDTYFPPQVDETVAMQKRHKSNQKFVTGLVAVCLIVSLLLVFVVLPKATIAVYPKTEPITRDMEISLATAATNPDASKLILPAVKIDQTLEVHNTFQSQGKKQVGNKASGYVQIYNFTKVPINLKAQTTTLTVGSNSYVLVDDVLGLKPTTYTDPYTKEVNLNSLGAPVEVMAADGGDSYNVPAGTRMEITNAVFGSKPQLLYAKISTEISGGTTRYLSVIDADDVTAAQSSLSQLAVQTLQKDLQEKNLLLPEGGYQEQTISFTTDNPVGTETPEFVATMQAQVTGLAIDQNQLQKLITDRIGQTLSSGEQLLINSNTISNYSVHNLDLQNETAVLDAHFESLARFNVQLSGIAPELVGKSKIQANEILQSEANIDRVDITLAPSWQKNLPYFASKIKVNLADPMPAN